MVVSGNPRTFPLSPAVICTLALATTFFVVYFLMAAFRSYSQLGQDFVMMYGLRVSQLQKVVDAATASLAAAPMLCILFIGARMRALQIDPIAGNPQRWAQMCFYLCACAGTPSHRHGFS